MIEKKIQIIPFYKQIINPPIMFSELIQKTQLLFQNKKLGELYSWEKDGSEVKYY
jgi:hypothetical protein